MATDIYVSRRATTGDAWGNPMRLAPPINSARSEWHVHFSVADPTLYFERSNGYSGPYELWQAPILPTVDFNGDGKVDAKDLALLVANWGKSNSVCDIGPFPWGDGVVDTQDLRVLMEKITGSGLTMNPLPQATAVPCDAILSWTSVSFAQTCDVYFGTSLEDVNSADRTNPQRRAGQPGTDSDHRTIPTVCWNSAGPTIGAWISSAPALLPPSTKGRSWSSRPPP